MAQAGKADRRNIESRMMNRGNRTGAKSAEQQASEAGIFAKRINESAEFAYLNNGGIIGKFVAPLNPEKIAWQTFKREAKRVGRLDKFSKRYVGA